MRLIDADALCYEDVECIDGNTYMVVHAPEIDNAPTAYDIDGVVEQLKRCYGIVRSPSVDYAEGLKDAYERAIGIVKAGGVYERS